MDLYGTGTSERPPYRGRSVRGRRGVLPLHLERDPERGGPSRPSDRARDPARVLRIGGGLRPLGAGEGLLRHGDGVRHAHARGPVAARACDRTEPTLCPLLGRARCDLRSESRSSRLGRWGCVPRASRGGLRIVDPIGRRAARSAGRHGPGVRCASGRERTSLPRMDHRRVGSRRWALRGDDSGRFIQRGDVCVPARGEGGVRRVPGARPAFDSRAAGAGERSGPLVVSRELCLRCIRPAPGRSRLRGVGDARPDEGSRSDDRDVGRDLPVRDRPRRTACEGAEPSRTQATRCVR